MKEWRYRLLYELNIKINIEKEQKRTFKNFAVIENGTHRTLVYNDGSESGLKIVTFAMQTDFSNTNNIASFTLRYH
jgi:hypothetical protein